MKSLTCLLMLAAAQWSWALAVEADSVSGINERTASAVSLTHRAKAPFYQASDADRYYERAYSLSDINASYLHRHEYLAAEPWRGDGASTGVFDASAYLRLGHRSVAFAGAGYEIGIENNVRWNSTADYRMLYPYVVGDSIGGDLNREQYHFYGGFASSVGRFVYGLGAKYRAVHQYRDYDPRPRNMGTDLSVSASGSLRIGGRALGIGADVRFYKQVMDVAYYSQAGANSTQFHFTGLGHTYGRIDGTTYTETRHKGIGIGVSASWLPVDREGFMAEADFSRMRVNRQIHEFNEAPLTTLVTSLAQLRAGYQYRRGVLTHTICLEAAYQRREGMEAVIDNGHLGEFSVLGRHEKYHLNILSARAAWLMAVDRGRWAFEAEPSVGFLSVGEDYIETYSKVTSAFALPGLRLQAMRDAGRWLFVAGLDLNGRISVRKHFGVTAVGINKDIYAYEAYRFCRSVSGRWEVSPAVTVQRSIGNLGAVYLNIAYAERFHGYGADRCVGITAGWRFF